MKNIILRSVVLLMFMIILKGQSPVFILPSGFQGPPPPPSLPPDWTHVNKCWGLGRGTVSIWWTFFNDPDGDCISNQHCTFYWGLDGAWHRTNGIVDGWQMSQGGTPVNFNVFNCCPPPNPVAGGTGVDPNISGTGGPRPNCFMAPECSACVDLMDWARCALFCEFCTEDDETNN